MYAERIVSHKRPIGTHIKFMCTTSLLHDDVVHLELPSNLDRQCANKTNIT